MGLLDSISGFSFAGKADSLQKGNSNGCVKNDRAEVYPGVQYGMTFYKKLIPDNFWFNPGKADKKPNDFGNKYFDIFRKNIPAIDKDGWQTYPEMEVKATAKDMELLKRRGASTTTNKPNGAAQFVEGKNNKSVKIKGNMNKPEYIQITDSTNGKKNIYTYRKLSKNELGGKNVQMGNMQGHKLNGNYVYEFRTPLKPDAVKDYYILESVVDEKGNDLMKKDHVEVYALDAKVSIDSGTAEYNLVQDKDCDGNNKSSMKYSRRAK